MTNHSYIIIDDSQENIRETKAMAARFPSLSYVGYADNYADGLDLILEEQPEIVFLEIDPINVDSGLSLALINETYRYLKIIPKFIVTTKDGMLALDAIKHAVFDYLTKPLDIRDFRKTIFKLEKLSNSDNVPGVVADQPIDIAPDRMSEIDVDAVSPVELPKYQGQEAKATAEPSYGDHISIEKPLTICIKSYGDYRFINANDICYLKADNNSTDIHLNGGEMVTAFKTLKHFESLLQLPFVRIHNSYIVNVDYVSRIHTGNSLCYIKNSAIKLPFSKSYKDNVDAILNSITRGNYLEI